MTDQSLRYRRTNNRPITRELIERLRVLIPAPLPPSPPLSCRLLSCLSFVCYAWVASIAISDNAYYFVVVCFYAEKQSTYKKHLIKRMSATCISLSRFDTRLWLRSRCGWVLLWSQFTRESEHFWSVPFGDGLVRCWLIHLAWLGPQNIGLVRRTKSLQSYPGPRTL